MGLLGVFFRDTDRRAVDITSHLYNECPLGVLKSVHQSWRNHKVYMIGSHCSENVILASVLMGRNGELNTLQALWNSLTSSYRQ